MLTRQFHSRFSIVDHRFRRISIVAALLGAMACGSDARHPGMGSNVQGHVAPAADSGDAAKDSGFFG
jgi:hypothetical protein